MVRTKVPHFKRNVWNLPTRLVVKAAPSSSDVLGPRAHSTPLLGFSHLLFLLYSQGGEGAQQEQDCGFGSLLLGEGVWEWVERLVTSQVIVMGGTFQPRDTPQSGVSVCTCARACARIYMHVHTRTHTHAHTHIPLLATPILKRGLGPS